MFTSSLRFHHGPDTRERRYSDAALFLPASPSALCSVHSAATAADAPYRRVIGSEGKIRTCALG
ncbi:hypothetical protein GCM10010300_79530 [Streptomyces olivaceoviridis]|nr:hypothetical protein GCM10010300_79530 [Streptomyces olivaceoviridis]